MLPSDFGYWLVGIFIAFYIYIWNFTLLESPAPFNAKYNKFVMKVSSPKGVKQFIRTLFSFGYFRKSFARFLRYYRLKIFPVSRAEAGEKAPDATLVTLDGQTRSLLKDYILDPRFNDIPLILNMGSYT